MLARLDPGRLTNPVTAITKFPPLQQVPLYSNAVPISPLSSNRDAQTSYHQLTRLVLGSGKLFRDGALYLRDELANPVNSDLSTTPASHLACHQPLFLLHFGSALVR